MPAFYLTFIAVLLSGIGARDQATVAGLALTQARRPAVLVLAVITSLLTAATAAWAASWMLQQLPPPARPIVTTIALGAAGLESIVFAPVRVPREPTNSLGALGLVLLAGQLTDAVRFIIFAMSVGFAAPVAAGAAGALGGAALVTAAWARPELPYAPGTRLARRVAGAVLLMVVAVMFLQQIGIL